MTALPPQGTPPPPPLPPPPVGYMAPAPPKKKARWRVWLGAGVVAFVVLIIVLAAVSSPKKTPSAAQKSTGTSAQVSQPPTTAAPTTTSTHPAGPGLNQVATDGDFAFTVKSVQCGVHNIGGDAAPAGAQWCLATLSISNGRTPQEFFASNQKAIDATGHELAADDSAVFYLPNDQAAEGATVNPGVVLSVVVPFQLADTDSIKTLVLHDSAFSGGVRVNL